MGEGTNELKRSEVVIKTEPSPYFKPRPPSQSEAVEPAVEKIKADIAQTRTEMSGTVDAIQDRLRPSYIKDRVASRAKQATIGRSQDMFERIRENPIPAAMVAIGLGWFFTSRAGTQPQSYGRPDAPGTMDKLRGRAGDIRGQAQDRVNDLTGRAQDQVSQMSDRAQAAASTVQSRASGLKDQAQQQVGRARGGFEQMLQDNPLAVGAISLAVGAAVGLSAPSTSKEKEILGPVRDSLMDQAESKAQEVAQKAQQVARKAAATTQEEARNQGLAGN